MGMDTVYWRLPPADLNQLRSAGDLLACETYVGRQRGEFPVNLRRFDTYRGKTLTLLLDAIGDPADPFWPLFNGGRPIGDPAAPGGHQFHYWTPGEVAALARAMADLFQSGAKLQSRIDSAVRPTVSPEAAPDRIRLAVREAQWGFERLLCFFRLAEDAGDAMLWVTW
ncbi:MAG TPA: DUF1877 family protein [Herpetosiphonaceae bacterium]